MLVKEDFLDFGIETLLYSTPSTVTLTFINADNFCKQYAISYLTFLFRYLFRYIEEHPTGNRPFPLTNSQMKFASDSFCICTNYLRQEGRPNYSIPLSMDPYRPQQTILNFLR
ncbi:hypothetical protein CEXT_58131 [Caerostris extrusa]|uniref:Uncharacterized protein n=1 Tax=Caerostris extrusa TaxID=172846 RepID=A0AAV4MUH7_CAEEX|nr:hypothetical protein CEXT_58131 [Caerostris extrusa]